MLSRWILIFKHRWFDRGDTLRAIPDAMAERLARRVAASEARHTGEIRICVEAALPLSYVWRSGPAVPLSHRVRERALSWFGRLGIWDTEHNNGVLIYLLLAEHAIEVVADRALTRRVDQANWQAMVDRLGHRLHEGAFEDGLTAALEEVSALLVAHFPLDSGLSRPNELTNAVVRA
ncbi:TPM domain-containing protein [Hydrogenophaga sp. PAMC20947]|uniref:TPM domain-containing protein n=1 Tax=Hydrogenophaga sp. PAMC20947 TaxID=2565558 RepID=UPI00109DBE37|nr:TPM domain-containing protein [Hydrogenophaga sp. PAMC20947]QCB47260.1 TPM domain-containing protein [Hydrogenophaga sp. PAMC20947]